MLTVGGRLTVSMHASLNGTEVFIMGTCTSEYDVKVLTVGGRLTVSVHTSTNGDMLITGARASAGGTELLTAGTCTSGDGEEVLIAVHSLLLLQIWGKC